MCRPFLIPGSTLTFTVHRLLIYLRLGTPRELTLQPPISNSVGLHGENIKPTARMTRVLDKTSYTPPLTQKVNTTNNRWFLR